MILFGILGISFLGGFLSCFFIGGVIGTDWMGTPDLVDGWTDAPDMHEASSPNEVALIHAAMEVEHQFSRPLYVDLTSGHSSDVGVHSIFPNLLSQVDNPSLVFSSRPPLSSFTQK